MKQEENALHVRQLRNSPKLRHLVWMNRYITKTNHNWWDMNFNRGFLGIGELSTSSESFLLAACLPQLPQTGSSSTEFTSWMAGALLMTWSTLGFSLAAPLCLCFPKYFSSGSWQKCSLRMNLTPGTLKRYCTISTNECTISGKKSQIIISL